MKSNYKLPSSGRSGYTYRFLSTIAILFTIMVVNYNPLQAQQSVFSRSDAGTDLWWNDNPANLPWYYQTWNNNQSQPDLPFNNPNYTRNTVFIGHNNNLTMTTNGRFFQLASLVFQGTANQNRTFNTSAGGGISLSTGITNNSTAIHTFNTPIGIDAANVSFNAGAFGGTLTFQNPIFINGNILTLTGTDGNINVSGEMSGNGSVTKASTSTVTITGTHTYTGGTTVNAGTFILSGGLNRLATTGALTVNGGIFRLDNIFQTVGTTQGTGGTIELGSGRLTMNTGTGTTLSSKITGTGGITKATSGLLILAGANEYSGFTQINNDGGILEISADNNLGTAPATPTENIRLGGGGGNNADLRVTESFTLNANRSMTLFNTTASRMTVGTGKTLEYNGIISGTGGLVKQQDGTLILGGANGYEGTTTVSGGVLNIRNSTALGTALGNAATGTTISNGFTLSMQGGISVGNEQLTLGNTGIGGLGALRNISGNNSWGGNLVVTSRTVVASDAGRLTLGGSISSNIATPRTVDVFGDGDVEVTGTFNVINVINRGGENGGTGTLFLNNANLNTGNTNILSGSISFNNNLSFGSSTLNFGGSYATSFTLIPAGGARSIDNNVTMTANVDASNPAIISGSNALTINGTVSATGGSRALSSNSSELVTLAGNMFLSNDNTTGGRSFTFGGSGNILVSGNIANNSTANTLAIPLFYTGSGTLTFTGSNSYTGLTTVSSGTLRLNRTGGGTLPATNNVTVSGTGILRISTDQTLNSLTVSAGATVVVDNGATLTITGTFTGGGIIDNKGTLNLEGGAAQTFPGATTTINNGTANQMNNLTITNVNGVTLNKEFTVNGTLNLASGALTIGANQTLSVNGGITGTGTLTGSQTTGLILGGGSGTVSFTTGSFNNYLKTLSLSGNASYTLGDTLKIVAGTTPGLVTLSGSSALNSNGFLVLKSDVDGTAAISAITSSALTPVAGNITVERYIPSGRKWRLLSLPVSSASLTIRDAWADGATVRVSSESGGITSDPQPAGRGTLITGHSYTNAATANAAGYDWWSALYIGPNQGAGTSLRRFTPTPLPDGDWKSNVASRTTIGTVLNAADPAYMLFIRGDRTVIDGSKPTVLTPVGALKAGDVTLAVPATTAAKYFTYGNPYPSVINFAGLYNENSTKIEQRMHVWDANLGAFGGYRTVTFNGSAWTDNISGPVANVQYIRSGQGVMLETKSGTATTMVTKETHKVSGTPGLAPFSISGAGSPVASLNVLLNTVAPDGSLQLVDGTTATLAADLLVANTDRMDIEKIGNFASKLGISFINGGKLLSFEGRPPVREDNRLNLNISGGGEASYALTIRSYQMSVPGLKGYLVDKFLGTETDIALDGSSTTYNFSGTSDAGSVSPTRFDVVFRASVANEIQLVVQDGRPHNIANWTVAEEANMNTYEVEYRRGSQDYRSLYSTNASGSSPAAYSWIHKNAGGGKHYYRIKGTLNTGETVYSNEVSFETTETLSTFTVFPNIVSTQSQVSMELKDFIPGNYRVSIVDAFGKVLQTMVVKHGGGTATYSYPIPAGLASGIYQITIAGRGISFSQSIMKQ